MGLTTGPTSTTACSSVHSPDVPALPGESLWPAREGVTSLLTYPERALNRIFFKIRLHPPNNAFNNRRRFKEILILTEWSFAKCKYEIIFESSGHTDVILSDYNSSNHYQEDHKSQIIYDIRKRI